MTVAEGIPVSAGIPTKGASGTYGAGTGWGTGGLTGCTGGTCVGSGDEAGGLAAVREALGAAAPVEEQPAVYDALVALREERPAVLEALEAVRVEQAVLEAQEPEAGCQVLAAALAVERGEPVGPPLRYRL